MQFSNISPNPLDRVTPEMKRILKKKACRFDVHTHIFNYRDVPDRFLGVRLPFNERFLAYIEKKLHGFFKRRDTDTLSNLAYFINVFKTRSPEEIFIKLKDYYPGDNTVFCTLMMDMSVGIAGKSIHSYTDQIENMVNVRDRFPAQILPFFAADPNNTEMKSMFLKVFSQDEKYRFFGVKIYPSLGYLPSHPDLMAIFAVCEEKNIPITAHCGGAVVHTSRRHIRDIQGYQYIPGEGFSDKTVSVSFRGKKDYATYLNHPRNWIPVLERFPKLRLNLAHFGGDAEWGKFLRGKGDSWVSRIIDLMERYENIYSDFSYTLHNKSFYTELKALILNNELLADRVLYGSDYYMVVKEGFFRAMRVNFHTSMGDEIMKKIAGENAGRFLFG